MRETMKGEKYKVENAWGLGEVILGLTLFWAWVDVI